MDRSTRLYQRALYYGQVERRLKQEDAQDFAAFAVTKFLELGQRNLPWLIVDYLRHTNRNRKGNKGYETTLALRYAAEFKPHHEPIAEIDQEECLAPLIALVHSKRTQDVLRLTAQGMTPLEISKRLNLSKSRITQIVRAGVNEIKKRRPMA